MRKLIHQIERHWLMVLIVCLFRIIKKIWFLLACLVVGGVLFLGVGQAKDTFFGLIYDHHTGWHFSMLCLVTILWGLSNWYGSRQLLRLIYYEDQQKPVERRAHLLNGFTQWVPRVLGLIPFLINLIAIHKEAGLKHWYVVVMVFLALSFLLAVWWRRRFFSMIFHRELVPHTTSFYHFNQLPAATKKTIIAALVLALILITLFCIRPIAIWLGPAIGAISMVVLGLAVWSWIGVVLTWLDARIDVPVNILLLVSMLIFSAINNNDSIQKVAVASTTSSDLSTQSKPTIAEYFKGWMAHRKDSVGTVVLVAGEGGGSRASYWTSGVLDHLQQEFPSFYPQVFALSTVSGSSAGAGFYNAWYRDSALIRDESLLAPSKWPRSCASHVAGKDYLSPLNAALLFSEVVQGISPLGINHFDRAKYLEDAWSKQYYKFTRYHTLEEDYRNLWALHPYDLPIHFFNTTVVERGQKGIISPLTMSDDLIFDVDSALGRPIPLKTAMSLSARFPVFTSPGTVPDLETGKDLLNLVDGGYYENTGLETAFQIMNEINTMRDQYPPFRLVILFIRNSDISVYDEAQPLNFLDVASIPLMALYQTWATETAPMLKQTASYLELVKKDSLFSGDTLMTISLPYCEEVDPFPLSRYMSDTLRTRMDAFLDQLTGQERPVCDPGQNQKVLRKLETLLKPAP